ncbi:M23 family metallopeptidase [Parabacteroides sp. AF18-52]|uniref:M23 family metallopeptidase n=1 Tax=Parabacteroides sp. AF18-52 TaxID=2292242 RepID=UPI001F37F21A|nr:M23 family metallopeptidase [Parabacteroides sp. AF18-52]
MMPKIYSYILSFITLITLSTCSSVLSVQSPLPVTAQEVAIAPPASEVPLPKVDYIFLPPAPELGKTEYARKDITEDFSLREKADIAVPDPKLLANDNSLVIDLALITEEDYAFPLPGAKVISPYAGRRRHHSGVDLKTCANDTIVAAFDGIVRIAKPYAAYGNVVVIRHYNGLETVYSHNSKNLVKVGERVKAGDPVGLTGRTGRATTEHLHFEVRINGQHFDPNKVFDLEKRKLHTTCLVATKTGRNIAVKAVDILPHQRAGEYQYSYVGIPVSDKNKKINL